MKAWTKWFARFTPARSSRSLVHVKPWPWPQRNPRQLQGESCVPWLATARLARAFSRLMATAPTLPHVQLSDLLYDTFEDEGIDSDVFADEFAAWKALGPAGEFSSYYFGKDGFYIEPKRNAGWSCAMSTSRHLTRPSWQSGPDFTVVAGSGRATPALCTRTTGTMATCCCTWRESRTGMQSRICAFRHQRG
jgi:hypothetical protein